MKKIIYIKDIIIHAKDLIFNKVIQKFAYIFLESISSSFVTEIYVIVCVCSAVLQVLLQLTEGYYAGLLVSYADSIENKENCIKEKDIMKYNREYYFKYDFYNMKSDDQITILNHFKTKQATLDYACGPNAILMILNYFNDYSMSEKDVFDKVKCKQPGGTKIEDIVTFLRQNNYDIETSIEQPRKESGKVFDTMEAFRDFVISNLEKGYPILVESVYYGGHYQVIIGYDKRSEEGNYKNDTIIFADSNDSTDDYIDGYNYFSAYKFYKMWFDDRFFPEEQRKQPYILVKGKNN